MPVLVSNLQKKVPVDDVLEQMVEKVALTVLAQEGVHEESEISIVFVDNAYIQQLNLSYREMDAPTDVLSFALEEGEPLLDGGEERMLGDVVISLEKAVEQGEAYGHGNLREVAYLTAHGVLHLLGYDHASEEEQQAMRQKEEAALSCLGLGR